MAHTYFALFCKIYKKASVTEYVNNHLTEYSLVGAEDSNQFLFVQLFALAKELHFSLSSWKNGIKNSMQIRIIFLELPFEFHINGQVCHMSVGIVEYSILQYI